MMRWIVFVNLSSNLTKSLSMNKDNIILTKSFKFALLTIETCKMLHKKKEFVLSNQFMRSRTSVGANVREAQNAESKKDFIHKLSISQKECDESIYWIELLYRSEFIDPIQYENLNAKATELLKILKSIILSAKRNLLHHS